MVRLYFNQSFSTKTSSLIGYIWQDDDGSGTIDRAEFVKGMRELNVEYNLTSLNDKALKHLFSYFGKYIQHGMLIACYHMGYHHLTHCLTMTSEDKDDSGFITYDEFLVGIRVSRPKQ